MSELQAGETHDLSTRCGGGVEIRRDEMCPDGFAIDKHGGELYRDEIKRLAELAGFDVSDPDE